MFIPTTRIVESKKMETKIGGSLYKTTLKALKDCLFRTFFYNSSVRTSLRTPIVTTLHIDLNNELGFESFSRRI